MADILRSKVTVTAHALVRPLPNDEAVVLNLETETYYGLSPTAHRMWNALKSAPDVETAFAHLSDQFDVDADRLRSDLETLIDDLVDHGLLAIIE
jgi:hypothetical protein